MGSSAGSVVRFFSPVGDPIVRRGRTHPRLMSIGSPAPDPARRAISAGLAGDRPAEALLEAVARAQDRQAFGQLFGEYGPRVKGFLARRVDAATADELLQ